MIVKQRNDADALHSPMCMPSDSDTTRGDVCPDEARAAKLSRNLAITGAVAGGSLAAVALYLGLDHMLGSGERDSAASCGPGPGDIGVACRIKL